MTVMIVEDTAILRKIMRDILKEFCGMADSDIHDAEDAIKAIRNYKIIKPDIVFLDISMPKINGKMAIGQILTVDPNANIIMFTGSRGEKDVKECILAGAKDYLVKPLSPKRVQEAVRNVMGSAGKDKLPKILRND
ncbi:MAG: response regulator [Defluviitaleaceae bacterium]|nr:response regulator [Defluviitaleaceae bacterium]